MITDFVITKIEEQLESLGLDWVEIVPESLAYPNSGSIFIRVTGDYTDVQWNDQSAWFQVYFSIHCSIRVRDYPIQGKRTPYLTLVDLSEQCFFALLGQPDLIVDLRGLNVGGNPITASYNGRFEATKLNTRVRTVGPNFFGSMDQQREPSTEYRRSIANNDTRAPAGYVLDVGYKSPKIVLPMACLQFLEPPAPAPVSP